jgi:hypothetical protein
MNLGFSIGGLAGGGKITRAVWKVGFRLDFIIIQIVFFNHAKSSNVNRATCYYANFFFWTWYLKCTSLTSFFLLPLLPYNSVRFHDNRHLYLELLHLSSQQSKLYSGEFLCKSRSKLSLVTDTVIPYIAGLLNKCSSSKK